jgi:PDGLE domain
MTERDPTDAPPADGVPSDRGTDRPARHGSSRYWWIGGLAIAVLVVVILVPLASADPDGLESVARDQGFIGAARDAVVGLLPGYAIPGLDGGASKVLAGLAGVAIVFGLMTLLGRMVARRRN